MLPSVTVTKEGGPGKPGSSLTDKSAVASEGSTSRTNVSSGGMKLPLLPSFNAETQVGLEGEAYEHWLWKLGKHAE